MSNLKYIKCPLNYTGGKYKMLKHLLPNFKKDIDTFVDLFAGGFNVGVNVSANTIYCNDHIHYLIELYKHFQLTDTEELIRQIKNRISYYELTETNNDGYSSLRKEYNKTKNILDLFVLTCYSFNHQIRFNNNHEFNTPFGKDRSSYNSRIEHNLTRFCSALKEKNIVFTNMDFTAFDYTLLKCGDFVYCDPPYLITNGSYNDGKRGFKDWTNKEEVELLNVLDMLNAQGINFALSNVLRHKGQLNKLLADWSKKYTIIHIDKSYSNCSYQFKDRNTKTVEVLITNYERVSSEWKQTSLI